MITGKLNTTSEIALSSKVGANAPYSTDWVVEARSNPAVPAHLQLPEIFTANSRDEKVPDPNNPEAFRLYMEGLRERLSRPEAAVAWDQLKEAYKTDETAYGSTWQVDTYPAEKALRFSMLTPSPETNGDGPKQLSIDRVYDENGRMIQYSRGDIKEDGAYDLTYRLSMIYDDASGRVLDYEIKDFNQQIVSETRLEYRDSNDPLATHYTSFQAKMDAYGAIIPESKKSQEYDFDTASDSNSLAIAA